MNFLELGIPFHPVPDHQVERLNRAHRNKVLRIIEPVALQSVSSTTFATSTIPITDIEKSAFCIHRQFGILTADILYSFDCSNATDDISGTYNGVPAASLQPDFDDETLRTMQPTYVTPDYSGQGAAIKLNSSITYQYIRLLRSPKFFNKTFTISAWVNPALSAGSLAALLGQAYQNGSSFFIGIIDRRPRIRVYNTFLETTTQLKNFQWQYLTYVFAQEDLSMAIYIDGILNAHGGIGDPEYGNFGSPRTTIGSADEFNQYNGLIDQLSIAYHVKNRIDVLDEATLVVHYTFEDNSEENNSLFNDVSANSIRAIGAHVTRLIDNRRAGQGTLHLYDSALSWFQSSGFALLVTHNYTYSYAFWLYIANASSFMPLVHLVARDEVSTAKSNSSVCLAMLIANKTAPNDNTIQLSLYIYGPEERHIITSTVLISQSTWYHIAVISETNSFKLYVNGTLVASYASLNMSTFKINNQQRLTLTIGNPVRESINDTSYISMCHTGETQIRSNRGVIDIDDLQFYSRPLNLRQIQSLTNDEYSSSMYFFT